MKVDQPNLRRMVERGDEAAFVAELEPLCQKLARETAAPHWEREDLVQEARAAAVKAFRTYRRGGGTNPLSWAVLIIRRELWRVAKRDLNVGRQATLHAMSLDAPLDPAEPLTLGNVVPAGQDTAREALARAELDVVLRQAEAFPVGEQRALVQAMIGQPYSSPQLRRARRRLGRAA